MLPISLLGEQRHMGVNSLPETVTWQHRGCDLNPARPSAPESSTLTTRLPSHPSPIYSPAKTAPYIGYARMIGLCKPTC